MPKRRKWLKILKIIVAAEIVLQVFSFGRYVYSKYQADSRKKQEPAIRRTITDPDYTWWLTESPSITSTYAPFVGWTTDQINTQNIHAGNGIRRTEGNPVTVTPDTKTMYFFGGSTMWGVNVKDSQAIPSFLAKTLNEQRPEWQLDNFGEIGYASTQEVIKLLLLLKENRVPTIAVFYDGCNDLGLYTPYGKRNQRGFEDALAQKLGDIYIYFREKQPPNLTLINVDMMKKIPNIFYSYIKIIRYPVKLILWIAGERDVSAPSAGDGPADEQTIREAASALVFDYEQNARMIDSLSREYGFQYILIWQPQLMDKENRSDQEKKIYEDLFLDRENDPIWKQATKMLKEKNIKHFYDLTDVFDSLQQTVFLDRCHTTPEGNEITTDRIKKIISLYQ